MDKFFFKFVYFLGYSVAWIKRIPKNLRHYYYEVKYGGANKVPIELVKDDISQAAKNMINAQDFKFSIYIMDLHKKFNISTDHSNTFTIMRKFYQQDLNTINEYSKISSLMRPDVTRREIFNLMVENKDIPEHKLNYFFPVGEKRQELEDWLDGKIK